MLFPKVSEVEKTQLAMRWKVVAASRKLHSLAEGCIGGVTPVSIFSGESNAHAMMLPLANFFTFPR